LKMSDRIRHIYKELERLGLDGLLVSYSPNISYLTRIHSRDAYLIVSKKKNVYLTDFRYAQETRADLKGMKVEIIKGGAADHIRDACSNLKIKRIGFEERHMSFFAYKKIISLFPKKTEFLPVAGLIEGMRQVKDSCEVHKIRKAVEITIQSFRFIKEFIRPGIKEIEVAGEMERFIRQQGAQEAAFDIIVACGPNSSRPHHLTSQEMITADQPVLIDIGVSYQGYKSDLTRVFFLGKITSLFRRTYAIVLKAQERAIKKIKPGVKIKEVDASARQYIIAKGYGGFFGHALGHGIGLETHESPSITGGQEHVLKKGMVFTLEPAVYIPGKFGIRIEDMVLVTDKGCEVLSGALHK